MNVNFFFNYPVETGILLSGSTLVLALLLSHFSHRIVGIFLFSISLCFALYFNYIDFIGISVSIIYFIACYRFKFDKSLSNILLGVLIFIISVGLLLHLVPGFYNPVMIASVLVSDNAPQYSQYLNFDKALIGFGLLCFIISKPKAVTYGHYYVVIGTCLLAYTVSFLIAIKSGLVQLDIKFPDYFIFWCLVNLFVTTYAEEAFFRGFIQRLIFKGIKGWSWGVPLTIILSGLLFGLAHFPGGITYVIIATLLGCTYAFCYMRSKNIMVPILAHFIFNLIHFTVFTYPFVVEV
jgi:hypothetical protein